MAKTDVTPSIFAFQSREIRTIVEETHVWFVAKDICRALGLVWKGNEILASIPEAWKGVRKLRTPRGGIQSFLVILEPAVYKLAFRSNKPEADAFTNWVASEVLPSIRKTGGYSVKQEQYALPPAPPVPSTASELRRLTDALKFHMHKTGDAVRDMERITVDLLRSIQFEKGISTNEARHSLMVNLNWANENAFKAFHNIAETIERNATAMRVLAQDMR